MLQVYRDRGAFDTFSRFQRQMDRLLSDRDAYYAEPQSSFGRTTFREADGKFVFETDVPGLAEGDVAVTIHQGTLSLRGESKGASANARKFARSFALPCKVDLDKSEAVLKNGVLTVTLVKAAEAQPRAIAVKAG